MNNYFIRNIADILKGEYAGLCNDEIRFLVTDSRTVVSTSHSLFFAIKGDRHDGHDFIPELIDKGIRNFVVSEFSPQLKSIKDANFVIVQDTLKALQELAAYHRKQFDCPVVGITGSNGKTVLKEWIFQVLEDKKVIRSPKSYNSQLGVPLSVWLLEKNTDIAIFEAGISKIGEMSNLQKIIQPNIGVFTNIGDAHQENFIDHKHKVIEKLKLFSNADVIIYCKDYQIIESQIQQTSQYEEDRLFSWSRKFPANLFVKEVEKGEEKTRIQGKYKNKEISIEIPFVDDASIENAIHVWSFMLYLEYDQAAITERMSLLTAVAMRLELKQGLNNCTVINDSYNSDLGSLSIAIDFVNQQSQYSNKVIILSDILQSGKDENLLYKEVADLLKKKNIKDLIGIGSAISRHHHLFPPENQFYQSTDDLLRNMRNHSFHDMVILLKGARKFEFERISNILQQKVHETVLEINLNAVTKNLNYFRSLLKPSTRIMVMVKAFSYGIGVYEIASLLQFQRVDYLAVAFADEGIELRNAGITLPILVLNPEIQSYDVMIEHHLEPEIYSFKVLDLFLEAVNRNRINSFPVHLKIDSGMHRMGFEEKDIPELIQKIQSKEQLVIKTIFSHLSSADEQKHDQFTLSQIEKFDKLSKEIMKAITYPVKRHILNSPGIERFTDAQFDMIRLGIGIYGISAISNDKLENVSTLKSSISQIKHIKKGETIGYSRQGKALRDTIIAIVPIGYADGLNRKLSNGVGEMLVNGKIAPVVGNICMDMCMLDITDINAKEGDEVIIFGSELHISEIAKKLDTIPYEIMTSISERVKRIYYHE